MLRRLRTLHSLTRVDYANLGNLRLELPDRRGTVALKELATINDGIGANQINRENARRRVVVRCNTQDRDLASAVAEIQQRVGRQVQLPEGYFIEYGGQFESQQSASERLGVLFIAVIAGLFMLLVLAFGSARDAVLVMVNLPLALIGGVAGVFLAGGVLSVASMIGFITLFGIATRNGIMLVSHVRYLMEKEGVADFRQAVERGAQERLIPILMTAMAAGLALIPLAVGGGKAGSEIQTPMAIVILCGLMTSTLLNMVVVPTMYLRYGRPAPTTDDGRAR